MKTDQSIFQLKSRRFLFESNSMKVESEGILCKRIKIEIVLIIYIYIYIFFFFFFFLFGHVIELSIECQAAYVPERGSSQHVVQKGIFFLGCD